VGGIKSKNCPGGDDISTFQPLMKSVSGLDRLSVALQELIYRNDVGRQGFSDRSSSDEKRGESRRTVHKILIVNDPRLAEYIEEDSYTAELVVLNGVVVKNRRGLVGWKILPPNV